MVLVSALVRSSISMQMHWSDAIDCPCTSLKSWSMSASSGRVPAAASHAVVSISPDVLLCSQAKALPYWSVARGCALCIEEGGSRYARCSLARWRLCRLLEQLQKPLSASPRQLPHRQPPLLAHLEGQHFSLRPFA